MLNRHAVERAEQVRVHAVALARRLRDAGARDGADGLGLQVQRLAARLVKSSEVYRVKTVGRRGYDLRHDYRQQQS